MYNIRFKSKLLNIMYNKFKNILKLRGLRTDTPADKIGLGFASDIANIDFSSEGMIQTKKGMRIFGNKTSDMGSITRGFLYKKDFGTLKKVLIRVRDNGTNSILEWFNSSSDSTNDGAWEQLVGGLTTGAIMGMTAFNDSDTNKMVFCNAVENYSIWNGATATVVSVTANTIVCNETLASEGFDSSGDIEVNGTQYAYTGITAKTFTGVTGNPVTGSVAANEGVAQTPDTSSYSALDNGNILATIIGRVWMAGIPDYESQLNISKDADATNFSASTTPASASVEDMPDGGGPITHISAYGKQGAIIHKEDNISIVSFGVTDDGTAKTFDRETISSAEGIGATNLKAGTIGITNAFYVSGIEGLKAIVKTLESTNFDIDSYTDDIIPTIEEYDFSSASAVYFRPKRAIYIACKASSDSTRNDKIISVYIRKDKTYDISIDDGFINDWIVDGNKLYGMASNTQNTYLLFDQRSDRGVAIDHKYVSQEFTYDEPANMKEFDNVYLEGFIGAYTKIRVTIMYGLLGSKGSKEKVIAWNDDEIENSKI